jgi:hypothetical protein
VLSSIAQQHIPSLFVLSLAQSAADQGLDQSDNTGCRSSRSSSSILNGFRSTGTCCKACGNLFRVSLESAVMIAMG